MDMIQEGGHIARQDALRGTRAPAMPPGEYLAWRLGAEEYAVDIRQVREIRSYETPTRMPGAAPAVKGVINLRGEIVPVVDLRLRLGEGEPAYTEFTVVIVLAVRRRRVGVVVDAVSDVLELASDALRPAPELARDADAEFITAVASVGERMLLLVDMEQLLCGLLGAFQQPE